MASSNRPTLPATGTVTARVQRLQNPAELESSATSSPLPRPMTHARESGITVGRSRRMDSSFGSLAGRASRGGNEGLRGDGRPPVGDVIRTIHSSVEKEVILRSPQLSIQRPATSFDMGNDSNFPSDQVTPVNALQPSRKPRSLESLQQPKMADNEIFQARSRLRPVKQPAPPRPGSSERRNDKTDASGHQNEPSQDGLDSRRILSELDTLLVGALERANTTTGQPDSEPADSTVSTCSRDQSSNPRPSSRHHSCARDSLAASQFRLQSTSRHPKSNTENSFVPESSIDADPVENSEVPFENGPAELPSNEQQENLPVATSLQKGSSPVKARMAVFERIKYLNPGDSVHDRLRREDNIPTSSVRSIRQKFEKKASRPPQAHTPPIELALPRLISHPRRDSQWSSELAHSESCQDETAKQPAAINPGIIEPTQDRKFSVPWPFKWNLFPQDKRTPAPPKPSGVEAKAETRHDEHATDNSVEHIMNHTYVSPAKSALSTGREPCHKGPASGDLTGLGATEASFSQEGAEAFMEERINMSSGLQGLEQFHQETDPVKSQTPEKRNDLISGQLTTPTKLHTPRLKSKTAASSPRTPLRGRARSGRRDSCCVEQRYSLSRSRSRGGLKIQVEVRSPDPSPDKGNEDTVVIIRTNIEPMDQ